MPTSGGFINKCFFFLCLKCLELNALKTHDVAYVDFNKDMFHNHTLHPPIFSTPSHNLNSLRPDFIWNKAMLNSSRISAVKPVGNRKFSKGRLIYTLLYLEPCSPLYIRVTHNKQVNTYLWLCYININI